MEIDDQERGWPVDRTAMTAVVVMAFLVVAGMAFLFSAGSWGAEALQRMPAAFAGVTASGPEREAMGWSWLAGTVWNLHPGHALVSVSDRIAQFPLFSGEGPAGFFRAGGNVLLSPISDPVTLLAAAVLAFWLVWGEAKRIRKLMRTRRR